MEVGATAEAETVDFGGGGGRGSGGDVVEGAWRLDKEIRSVSQPFRLASNLD